MTEKARAAFIALLVSLAAPATFAADWYVSDASGMTLERTTENAAKRLEYGLSIEPVSELRTAPQTIREAVPSRGAVELRTLYERGAPVRRRYAALDVDGFERLVETRRTDGSISRERYDQTRRFVEEARLGPDGEGTVIRYFYTGTRLARAEAFSVTRMEAASEANVEVKEDDEKVAAGEVVETPLWTDTYVYLRSGALRSVERAQITGKATAPVVTEGARFDTRRGVPRGIETRSTDGSSSRSRYDESGRVVERSTFDETGNPIVTAEITAYEDEGATGVASVVRTKGEDGVSVETSLDSRGRAVGERRTDAEGVLLSETRTVWSENRIASIETVGGAETRRTEYEYDAKGNRTEERNYRNGELERSVRRTNGEETEELYSDGLPVLRAVWVDGRKVSERRLRKGEDTER